MSHKGFFYNDKKQEVIGSDGLFMCDGRLNRVSTILEARRQAKSFDKNFPHKKITYVRLYRGRATNPTFTTGYINMRTDHLNW